MKFVDVIAELQEVAVEIDLHRLIGQLGSVELEQKIALEQRLGAVGVGAEDASMLVRPAFNSAVSRAGSWLPADTVEDHPDARKALLEQGKAFFAADLLDVARC